MLEKPILRKISRYKTPSTRGKSISNFKFSEKPVIFEQSVFTKQGTSGDHEDLLYEITESHLDFSHMIRILKVESCWH